MKYLSYIFLFVLLCFIACGKKQALNEDAMSTPDSLLNQQLADAGPSEDEISSLTDTAKQEKQKALDEKYQGLHIYVSKTTMHLYVLDKNDSVLLPVASLAACVVVIKQLKVIIKRQRATSIYQDCLIVPTGYIRQRTDVA